MISPLSPKQSRMVVLGVMLGLFLGAMEATVVATALPTIVSSLSGLELYAWPMAAYILMSAVTGPIFGKLSDLYGRKVLYFVSLGIFLAGSLLCGLARTMAELVIFRTLQGIGAGGVMPLSIIIAGEIFPLEKRAKIQPAFSIVWGVASLVGPPLGTWLASMNWRLVFWVNVPFGIVSGLLLAMNLLETRDEKREIHVDYRGGVLLTLGLLALEVGLPSEGGTFSWWKGGLLAASLPLLVFFVLHERTAREPMLPLSLMQYRIFSAASLCQFLTGIALFGSLSFIPLYVEAVFGKGIRGTGMVLSLLLASWVVSSFISSRLMLKIGYRFLVINGSALLTAGFLLLTLLKPVSPPSMLNLAVVLMGAGMGWIMAPLIVAVQTGVPRKHLGIATSSQVLFRTAGGSVGVSVMGAVLAQRLQKTTLSLAMNSPLRAKLVAIFNSPNLIMDPILRAQLPQQVLTAARSAMAFSLHGVFVVAALVAALAFLAGFLVPRGKAEEHSYREQEARPAWEPMEKAAPNQTGV